MKVFGTNLHTLFDETAGHFSWGEALLHLGTSSSLVSGTTSSSLLDFLTLLLTTTSLLLHRQRFSAPSLASHFDQRELWDPASASTGTRVRPDQRGVPIICCVTPTRDAYQQCALFIQRSLVELCSPPLVMATRKATTLPLSP